MLLNLHHGQLQPQQTPLNVLQWLALLAVLGNLSSLATRVLNCLVSVFGLIVVRLAVLIHF
jgi:hypothetical protein